VLFCSFLPPESLYPPMKYALLRARNSTCMAKARIRQAAGLPVSRLGSNRAAYYPPAGCPHASPQQRTALAHCTRRSDFLLLQPRCRESRIRTDDARVWVKLCDRRKTCLRDHDVNVNHKPMESVGWLIVWLPVICNRSVMSLSTVNFRRYESEPLNQPHGNRG
jgi:hypothetical protein